MNIKSGFTNIISILTIENIFKLYYQGEMLDVHQPCHWTAIHYTVLMNYFIEKFKFQFYSILLKLKLTATTLG